MTPQRRRGFRHLSAGLVWAALLQSAAAQTIGSPYAVLEGRWVRPDGGYTLYIRAVDAGGRIEASYANPRPLPFARAALWACFPALGVGLFAPAVVASSVAPGASSWTRSAKPSSASPSRRSSKSRP